MWKKLLEAFSSAFDLSGASHRMGIVELWQARQAERRAEYLALISRQAELQLHRTTLSRRAWSSSAPSPDADSAKMLHDVMLKAGVMLHDDPSLRLALKDREADAVAIGSYWQAVGRDLQTAMRKG